MPESVQHLLNAAILRLTCERLGVAQVDRKRDQVHMKFTDKARIDPGRLMQLVAKNAKKGATIHSARRAAFPAGRSYTSRHHERVACSAG